MVEVVNIKIGCDKAIMEFILDSAKKIADERLCSYKINVAIPVLIQIYLAHMENNFGSTNIDSIFDLKVIPNYNFSIVVFTLDNKIAHKMDLTEWLKL